MLLPNEFMILTKDEALAMRRYIASHQVDFATQLDFLANLREFGVYGLYDNLGDYQRYLSSNGD